MLQEILLKLTSHRANFSISYDLIINLRNGQDTLYAAGEKSLAGMPDF